MRNWQHEHFLYKYNFATYSSLPGLFLFQQMPHPDLVTPSDTFSSDT